MIIIVSNALDIISVYPLLFSNITRLSYNETQKEVGLDEVLYSTITSTSKADAVALRAAFQLAGLSEISTLAWNLAMSFDERCSRGGKACKNKKKVQNIN